VGFRVDDDLVQRPYIIRPEEQVEIFQRLGLLSVSVLIPFLSCPAA
jgi:hypothetical protein